MERLKNKVAIITGATSGMGRDTAYVFVEEGAKVMVVGRNEEWAAEVVENIVKNGGVAAYIIADWHQGMMLKKL
jgi:3-oxoacyl-[acyl-carrier protein] reductase